MKLLNQFFFGEDEICKHDKLWFYGSATVIGILWAIGIIVGLS